MAIRNVEELTAWQLARAFKLKVYRLLKESASARADLRFADQIRDAAASVGMNIAEGFYRFGAVEFRRFLGIALASLAEAALWLEDGVDRGHFTRDSCKEALLLSKRCRVATLRLHRSLAPKALRSAKAPAGPPGANGPEAPEGPPAPKAPRGPEAPGGPEAPSRLKP